jgi:hypothetical protein
MINNYRLIKVLFFSISLAILPASKAFCDDEMGFFSDFKQGHWRFESVAGIGLNTSEDTDRKGDYYCASSIDYEWSVYKSHREIALRAYPFLLYNQDRNDHDKTDLIYACAFGPLVRWYQSIEHLGGYAEIGVSILWNSHLFRGNAARWNGLTEMGFGYKFDSGRHVALKFQHISNGKTRYPNHGVNAIALCFGFEF